MPNVPPEFPSDVQSAREAAVLTNALREQQLKELDAQPAEMFFAGLDFESVRRVRSRLTGPLEEVSQEIPMVDIRSDVQDFGVLVAYSQATGGNMLVLHIGEKTTVPVLPQVGLLEQYQILGSPFTPPYFDWFRQESFKSSFDGKALSQVSLHTAQEGFFLGLKSFLAARIGGVRWWRSQKSGGGGGGTSGGVGGGGSAQLWEVHTDGSGLSLAYHGTHAARVPPTALPGGVTTPVDVYLPMGTLYIGANAGPHGAFIFDDQVVLKVPSQHPHPIHTTKVF
jgi:hypothetical protein